MLCYQVSQHHSFAILLRSDREVQRIFRTIYSTVTIRSTRVPKWVSHFILPLVMYIILLWRLAFEHVFSSCFGP
ncbi:hypothetical protein M6B38_391350 [Iris pallida]|uniref:Uncharacterized protein n=1 Tax=Iris pallida TaxID=29817 RepID=A0AAX6FYU7_IRIPA|nr:hypothetical protein M6B38_391350 [Iris pallida]